jgi:7-cyano-7-deazaguanine synthase
MNIYKVSDEEVVADQVEKIFVFDELPRSKAFVLLSGGLDSTTCLYKAIDDYAPDATNVIAIERCKALSLVNWVEAVSIDYGQRHKKEIEYAARTCIQLGIKHTILDVGKLLSGESVMLSAESIGNVEVPNISYNDIKGVSPTYVPFRNGTLLSAITAHAQKWVNKQFKELEDVHGESTHDPDMDSVHAGIYFGAHSEDARGWAYPDCTPEFIGAMANAIYIGTYRAVRLHTPLQWLMKSEVVELGAKHRVPFENTWSCYKGEELHCGVCPTCRSRKEAFKIAGIMDLTKYADIPIRRP